MIMVDLKPSTVQPVRTIDETPNIHSDNVVQQMSKDAGSELEAETWSFNKVINVVFVHLPFCSNLRKFFEYMVHCPKEVSLLVLATLQLMLGNKW